MTPTKGPKSRSRNLRQQVYTSLSDTAKIALHLHAPRPESAGWITFLEALDTPEFTTEISYSNFSY